MKLKVLITGRNGFLGSSMYSYMERIKGKPIFYGLVRNSLGLNSKQIIECDLNHTSRLNKILQAIRPDIIFHFAGGRHINDKKTFNVNFLTTKSLFEAVHASCINPRIIILGSAAEYGIIPGKQLITENRLPKPSDWYGFVKLMQTHLSLFYSKQGLDIVVARLFNICGVSTGIGNFAQQIVAIERGANPVIRSKNLSGQRDFCDIEDVCRGLWMIAQTGKKGEIYNLCSAKAITFRHILGQMLNYAKVKNIRVEEDLKDTSSCFHVVGSNTKFKSIAQWSPRISLTKSLNNMIDHARYCAELNSK